jgi:hypothetical protein
MIVPKVANFFHLSYRPNGTLSPMITRRSQIVRTARLSVYDEVYGTHDGVPLSIFDLNSAAGLTNTDILFQGLFITIQFNKRFNGTTLVLQRGTEQLTSEQRKAFKTVILESNDFNRIFEVLSTDQIEARVLLTPDIMDRLMELSERFPSGVQCSFVDETLSIAIPMERRLFMAGIENVSLYDTKDYHNYLYAIDHILSIINLLKVN